MDALTCPVCGWPLGRTAEDRLDTDSSKRAYAPRVHPHPSLHCPQTIGRRSHLRTLAARIQPARGGQSGLRSNSATTRAGLATRPEPCQHSTCCQGAEISVFLPGAPSAVPFEREPFTCP